MSHLYSNVIPLHSFIFTWFASSFIYFQMNFFANCICYINFCTIYLFSNVILYEFSHEFFLIASVSACLLWQKVTDYFAYNMDAAGKQSRSHARITMPALNCLFFFFPSGCLWFPWNHLMALRYFQNVLSWILIPKKSSVCGSCCPSSLAQPAGGWSSWLPRNPEP